MYFDYKIATQALNYLAHLEGGQIDKLKALKLIYFADKYHLRKYSSLISNDKYFAMQRGPVASSTKDIAEHSSFLSSKEKEYCEKYIAPLGENKFKSVAEIDKDQLSETNLESLKFAYDNFGHLEPLALVNLTHHYPEWKKHEHRLKNESRIEMNLEDFFDDPTTPNINKCFEIDDSDRDILKQDIREYISLVGVL